MLPRVCLWSLFRDDAGENIARYQQQIDALDYPANLLRLYLVEGDSRDDTLNELRAWAAEDSRVTVVKHDTGIDRMRHTPHPARLQCLADTGNTALEALAADRWGELACLLESDLLYQPDTLRKLVDHRPDNAAISPFIWIPGTDRHLQFYDIWAFRQGGKMFKPAKPEWYAAHYPTDSIFEVDSAGSMVLFPAGPIYDGVRYTDQAIIGICQQYSARGYRIMADPMVNILHPLVINPYPLVETQVNESE